MKANNDQLVAYIMYTVAFFIVNIIMCVKWYSIGFTWHDRFAYFGSLLGLIYFSSEAISEYKRLKIQ